MRRSARSGTVIVEVLVALGVLALALGSLVTLHAAHLRATRAAGATRDLAAAAEAEATLRSLVLDPGPSCLVAPRWQTVTGCVVRVVCAVSGCSSALQEITVSSRSGQTITVLSAGADAAAQGEGAP